MQFLETVPKGFHSSVEKLNEIKIDIIKDMSTKIVKNIHCQGLSCQYEDYFNLLKQEEFDTLQKVLYYIFKNAYLLNVQSTDFPKFIRKYSQMSVPHIKILTEVYEKNPSVNNLFDIGRLKNLEWKFGVGISSSLCSNLYLPFITLLFTIEKDNNLVNYCIEVTLEEFQDLKQNFKEMSQMFNNL